MAKRDSVTISFAFFSLTKILSIALLLLLILFLILDGEMLENLLKGVFACFAGEKK
jgi:predicted PurR-regulated permease PerM